MSYARPHDWKYDGTPSNDAVPRPAKTAPIAKPAPSESETAGTVAKPRSFFGRGIRQLLGWGTAALAGVTGVALVHEDTRLQVRHRWGSIVDSVNTVAARGLGGPTPDEVDTGDNHKVDAPAALNWNKIKPDAAKKYFDLEVVQGRQPFLRWVDEFDGSIQTAIPDPPRHKVVVQPVQALQWGKKIEVIDVYLDENGKCVHRKTRLISAKGEEKDRYRAAFKAASNAASEQQNGPSSETFDGSEESGPQ